MSNAACLAPVDVVPEEQTATVRRERRVLVAAVAGLQWAIRANSTVLRQRTGEPFPDRGLLLDRARDGLRDA